MVYTQKIKDAIKFATKTHEVYQKQKRKGKDIPYITHPLIVGFILARAGASEDVIVAGILHDTIEDSIPEKKVTKAMIAERFGETVAGIVDDVTEPNKELPWEERKQEALEHVERLGHDSLLVKSADLISNISEMIADYQIEGDTMFERFNAGRTAIIRHCRRMVEAVIQKWPENPLIDDLKGLDIMSMDPDNYSYGMNGALWRASHKGEPMVFVSTAGKTTEQIVKEGLDQSYKAGFLKKELAQKGFVPEQCALWKKQNIEESDVVHEVFDLVETYIDTSHLWRYLLKCKECGQLYFFEFYEEMNMTKVGTGDDWQYSTWIPIATKDDADALKDKSPLELLFDPALRPRIQADLTPQGRNPIKWIN